MSDHDAAWWEKRARLRYRQLQDANERAWRAESLLRAVAGVVSQQPVKDCEWGCDRELLAALTDSAADFYAHLRDRADRQEPQP